MSYIDEIMAPDENYDYSLDVHAVFYSEQKFKKACSEVDSLRAALQSAKEDAERARGELAGLQGKQPKRRRTR